MVGVSHFNAWAMLIVLAAKVAQRISVDQTTFYTLLMLLGVGLFQSFSRGWSRDEGGSNNLDMSMRGVEIFAVVIRGGVKINSFDSKFDHPPY